MKNKEKHVKSLSLRSHAVKHGQIYENTKAASNQESNKNKLSHTLKLTKTRIEESRITNSKINVTVY